MCGIAGFYSLNYSEDSGIPLLEKMLGKIAHRGPDATGTFNHKGFFLGHNRLSIIDLTEGANQPFHYGSFSIVFNGEIYNYIELREDLKKKGHQFHTNSDTEVILAAFIEFGSDCVTHFIGMWAFAILDRASNQLFCSRDRFGIKPFYFSQVGDEFVFASEQKAVLAYPGVSKQINRSMVARFLQMGWVDNGADCFFSDIKVLPPAHNLVLKNGEVQVNSYWDLLPQKSVMLNETDAIRCFHDTLVDSVKLHSRSDVTVGTCLSGGLDSSALSALMAKADPNQKIKAFHIYYTGKYGVDERPFAQLVAKHYANQIDLHEFTPSDAQITAHFYDFMLNMEVPVHSSSPYSQYFLMKLAAKEGVKVIIDGQGADEYLGGYQHAAYRYLYDEFSEHGLKSAYSNFKKIADLKSMRFSQKTKTLLKTALMFGFNENELYQSEFKYGGKRISKSAMEMSIRSGDFESRLLQFLYHQIFQTSLNNLLYYEDRNSMRFSIESRVPFLNHQLPEFIFNNARGYIIKEGWTKYILRKSIESYLPNEVTYRKDKKGFVTPGEKIWLTGPLKELLLQDDWLFPPQTVHENKANTLKMNYLKGDGSESTMVWRLAVLSFWYKHILPQF